MLDLQFHSHLLGLDLCIAHSINDEKDFVESYLAFSVSHLNGAEPSIESLDEFERKELLNQKKKVKESTENRRTSRRLSNFDHFDSNDVENDDELMGAYISKTPTVSRTISFDFSEQYFSGDHKDFHGSYEFCECC